MSLERCLELWVWVSSQRDKGGPPVLSPALGPCWTSVALDRHQLADPTQGDYRECECRCLQTEVPRRRAACPRLQSWQLAEPCLTQARGPRAPVPGQGALTCLGGGARDSHAQGSDAWAGAEGQVTSRTPSDEWPGPGGSEDGPGRGQPRSKEAGKRCPWADGQLLPAADSPADQPGQGSAQRAL